MLQLSLHLRVHVDAHHHEEDHAYEAVEHVPDIRLRLRGLDGLLQDVEDDAAIDEGGTEEVAVLFQRLQDACVALCDVHFVV